MSSKGLEMLRKHLSYYDFDPDKVVLLGNVLYYAKKAEFEFAGLEAENAKLRELVARMAEALGIDCEWADPNWCKSPCVLEFGCWPNDEHAEIRCPVWAAMQELGIEVTE